MSLKALAHKLNERDSERDSCGTSAPKVVPGSVPENVPAGQAAGQLGQVIEATFASVPTMFLYAGAEDIAPVEFPSCPGCEQRRYWLGTGGKVSCSICGVVRFLIVALEFRPVN